MTERGPLRLLLREMTPADIPAVRHIEVEAYEDAWPQTTFEAELRNAFATYVIVIDQDAAAPRSWWERLRAGPRPSPVAGYCGAWFHVDQMHIVTIAVAPVYQGRGIAQRLLLECFDRARAAELKNVALEVRPSNARARAIYERFGFQQVGVRQRYYANNGEDALIMLTPDLDTAAQHERLEGIRADVRTRFADVSWVTGSEVERVDPTYSESSSTAEGSNT